MNRNRKHYLYSLIPTAIAGITLVLLLVALHGINTEAAPLRGPGTGEDPEVRFVTLTSDLPYYDPTDGQGITKTVYFSNSVGGTLTMTFDITGTPTLSMTAGAAFGEGNRVYTSSTEPLTQPVTYTVETGDSSQYNIGYTATNTDDLTTTVAISYVQDITAPEASIVHPSADYFTGTQLVITGTAADNEDGAGVARVRVTTETTWAEAVGTTDWAYTTTFPADTDGKVYTIAAQAEDHLGTFQSPSATRAITVDNTAPENPDLVTTTNGIVTGTWIPTSTVPVSWTVVSDGSGVSYYYTWTQNSDTGVGSANPLTTATAVTGTDLSEDDNYFHIRTQDGANNWAAETKHLGPFKVDTVSPTVSIDNPAAGSVLTTAHQPTVTIDGTASDDTSGLSEVRVTTGTTWAEANGLGNWDYTWTLPITDHVDYPLRARAIDSAGNVSTTAEINVTVDTVAPTATAPVPHTSPWVTSTVVYTWAESSDGAGIAGYQIRITNTESYEVISSTDQSALTFTKALTEGAGYYARLRAIDDNSNVGAWSDPSDVVTPDLTPPTTSNPQIIEESDYFYVVDDIHLYYTNTMQLEKNFAVKGKSNDGALSGVAQVQFSDALGKDPDPVTSGFPDWKSSSYSIDSTTTASGTITATVYDNAGNTAVQTYTYALDSKPPTSTASSPDYVTSGSINVTWNATDTKSGVYSTTLWYKKAASSTWRSYATQTPVSDTFHFNPPYGDGTYLFSTVAADNLGNLEGGRTVSETETIYDTDIPQAEVTNVPDYENTSPITVTWEVTKSLGTIEEVRLWYRYNEGNWVSTTLTSTQQTGTGQFAFTQETDGSDDGTYDFAVVAQDEYGKSDGEPSGDVGVEGRTIYDTTAPTSEVTDAPEYDNEGDIQVDYTADGAVAGLTEVKLWYKYGDSGIWTDSGLSTTDTSGTFDFTPTDGDGTYYFQTVATDNAGNSEPAASGDGDDTTVYDTTAPTSEVTDAPAYDNEGDIQVDYTANDAVAGLTEVKLWYKYGDDGSWTDSGLSATGTSGSFDFTPTDGDGTYYFQTVAADNASNSEPDASGGGDDTTVYDTTAPTSEVTDAPEYDNEGDIQVDYTADGAVAGLTEVKLWYKYGDSGIWTDSGLSTTDTSGTFDFTPTDGDGTYYFQTVATDNAGNSEPAASGDGDDTTVYDTTAPTSEVTDAPAYDNEGDIQVDYTADGAVAGLDEVTLWYKYGDGGSWTDSGLSATGTPSTFDFTPTDGDGTYYFQTVAADNASNSEPDASGDGDAHTVYDTNAPTVTLTAPDHISETTFTVSWSAEDATSGVASYTLAYSSTSTSGWKKWGDTYTDTTQTTFDEAEAETDYTFRVTAYDEAGNSSDDVTTTYVGAFNIYLPLTVRNYAPFCPGYFDGDFGCWSADKGPFLWQGNEWGSGLGYSIVNNQARLGNPNYKNDAIPVGYAHIAQTFTVPDDVTTLSLRYRVISDDTIWGEKTKNYFDTFEVSINEHPKNITEEERDSNGCRNSRLNPDDGEEYTPTKGLVFCSGQAPTSDPQEGWDSEWRTISLDLSNFSGQNITLHIATWNREYDHPWRNDRGYFNTYAYVDDITLE